MTQHDIVIVGLNHLTAPLAIREQLTFADDALDDAIRRLRAIETVAEAAIVCTCNRVELVASSPDPDRAVEQLRGFLRAAHPGVTDLDACLYLHRGTQAVRHLFRVASSLDSMVVGEPQILGQLKSFYARAAAAGGTGAILHRCFHKAFAVAKRVRTETQIASRAVSVSSAAVELTRQIFDHLQDKTAMLIGAGKMAELAARHLLSQGVGDMIVTNRTFDRAVELAREFGATPVPFDHFPKYLQLADIIIGSTAATNFVLTPALMQDALRERKGRPVFCVDLSVPRNFDPRINEIDNVYLYDVDDLGGVAADNLGVRVREAEKAEIIVREEVDAFSRWLTQLEVTPTIVALREKAETIRRGELEKTLRVLKDVSPREREALESLTTAIVNKLLHGPITRLKDREGEDGALDIDATRRLFDLEGPDES
jgi:glutamyl-tRNA reductase